MTRLTRRQFGLFASASAAALMLPTYLRAQGKPRVVVIGGGAGGATAARYIAKDSDGALDVTLIDQSEMYTTCFYSNLYIGGFRSLESITHSYDALQSGYGITKVTGRAASVDRAAKTVTMEDGSTVPYDRLVVAPGIDLIWDSVEGYSEELSEIAPHAWKAGKQTELLKAKLDAIENGQQIVMVAPPNPYRCPPGPYERASMMAHVLKAKGLTDSKVIILDPKESFSKQGVFQEGWEKHYPGMVEWYGPDVHGGIASVDVNAGTVETDLDTFQGALLNIIPAQKAGAIAAEAGLTNDSGFCPIEAESMRSTIDEAVFVIGDASIAGDMPKSAFSANSQAKVAAMTIRGDLLDSKVFPAKYANTCWSLIETDDSIKVGAQYAPGDGKITSTQGFVSQTGEDAPLRKANYEESVGWYNGITADMFS
ncbi:MAG: NAD(P)/FAD-dependent oxidoreductase [Hoeflea sp.]|uniref:NAD(P)/FAD-dependent oxidoreductase n=1 Tax=Hoeflea sp. TaxID=1940281 RepID=UPI001DF6CA6F|nr:NAD(P)/FAD-dependent oxidoreductase [Hoeflea sp.]MBU4528794.1 NAD(P)/FAD-dependent oxidoreductase [Alphaproteobacteria bacterium]MBU4545879.1 NAD(P)/FAD-dependent oxidoreductase [Alphaproteobacteria bacterium]MBU4549928.1 NAD(P)/FAD-dependent oxidoreductase [Alphaproteobacteria bacterium]MBV1725925.1 NAD(P)/FAD-dependent oxidoreductase [Hoeflea sp.]MBV1762650.1 NAD(P)/FAD-dependent oxidoreductase [Hoeflea sp.]